MFWSPRHLLAAAALACCCLLGCEADAPEPNRGASGLPRQPGNAPPTAEQGSLAPAAAPTGPGGDPRKRLTLQAAKQAAPSTTITEELRSDEQSPEDEAPKGPERDLNDELRSALGIPTHCFPTANPDDLPNPVVLQVMAVVSRTGRVARSTVSGAGLEPDAVRCVEQTVDRARLPSPLPAAQTVTTQLKFQVRPVK